jgi:uncharacterized protein YodC (DUF2158 family)
LKPTSQTFKPGDLVRLRSGGPVMTLQQVSYDGESVYCQWFVNGKLHTGQFPPSSLKRASEDDVVDDD